MSPPYKANKALENLYATSAFFWVFSVLFGLISLHGWTMWWYVCSARPKWMEFSSNADFREIKVPTFEKQAGFLPVSKCKLAWTYRVENKQFQVAPGCKWCETHLESPCYLNKKEKERWDLRSQGPNYCFLDCSFFFSFFFLIVISLKLKCFILGFLLHLFCFYKNTLIKYCIRLSHIPYKQDVFKKAFRINWVLNQKPEILEQPIALCTFPTPKVDKDHYATQRRRASINRVEPLKSWHMLITGKVSSRTLCMTYFSIFSLPLSQVPYVELLCEYMCVITVFKV